MQFKASQHPISDHYRSTSKTPLGWHFACGPIETRYYMLTEEMGLNPMILGWLNDLKIDVSLHQLSWQLICHFVWYKLAFLKIIKTNSFYPSLNSVWFQNHTAKKHPKPKNGQKSLMEKTILYSMQIMQLVKTNTMLHYLSWRCFKWLQKLVFILWLLVTLNEYGLIRLRYMRSNSQCLQHLTSVVNSSASLVMKPFVHHLRGMNEILFLIEHLNVLEEFLITPFPVHLYLWEFLQLRKRREFH